jgi:hypothetical protein
MRLLVIAASVITATTRAITAGGRSTDFFGRRARHEEREEHAAQDRERAGDGEGGAPARRLHEEAGEHGGERDAEVAGEPVHADGEAGIARVLHQHRNADRVVDRREDAHERERGRQRPHARRRGHEQGRGADAEKEDDHHHPPAPEVPEASGRQRAESEHHERAHRVRHEVLPDHAPVGGDGAHRRGEDQQEQVIQRVAGVEEQRGRARL